MLVAIGDQRSSTEWSHISLRLFWLSPLWERLRWGVVKGWRRKRDLQKGRLLTGRDPLGGSRVSHPQTMLSSVIPSMGSVELSSLIPSMGSGGVFPLILSTGSMGLIRSFPPLYRAWARVEFSPWYRARARWGYQMFILRYRARAWWSFPPLHRAWARGSLGCSFIPPGTRALSRGRLILWVLGVPVFGCGI